jgi:hypothetical protein
MKLLSNILCSPFCLPMEHPPRASHASFAYGPFQPINKLVFNKLVFNKLVVNKLVFNILLHTLLLNHLFFCKLAFNKVLIHILIL